MGEISHGKKKTRRATGLPAALAAGQQDRHQQRDDVVQRHGEDGVEDGATEHLVERVVAEQVDVVLQTDELRLADATVVR